MDSFQSKSPNEFRPYWFDLTDIYKALGDTCTGAVVEVIDPETDSVILSPVILILHISWTDAGMIEFWPQGGALGDSVVLRVRATGARTVPATVVATDYGVLHVDLAA